MWERLGKTAAEATKWLSSWGGLSVPGCWPPWDGHFAEQGLALMKWKTPCAACQRAGPRCAECSVPALLVLCQEGFACLRAPHRRAHTGVTVNFLSWGGL